MKLLSLFSGIGAFEKALSNLNIEYELVNFIEIDRFASKSYCLIHNENENKNLCDITKVNEKELPDFDLMTYGFPCQPFSMAGLRNGKDHKKGNLFFDSMRIAEYKKPKWMIAENVKGLLSIEEGKYLQEIILYLDRLGYNNYFKVLNAKDYGIPQNRERIFIVSIRKDVDNLTFEFPKKVEQSFLLKDILSYSLELPKKYINSFYHKKGSFGDCFKTIENTINTLTTKASYAVITNNYYTKDLKSYKIKNVYDNDIKVFALTGDEYLYLMGFNTSDIKKLYAISNNIKCKLAGNSIVVNVLEAIFKQLFLNENKKQKWLF